MTIAIDFIARADWGAVAAPEDIPRESVSIKNELAIHHTVHSNHGWTRAQERDAMRRMEFEHMHRDPPFATIGYSWVVFPSGRIYVGRGFSGIPAATEGQNSGTWALAFVGDFRTAAEHKADGSGRTAVDPTVEARRIARTLIDGLRTEHNLNRLGGHREFPNQESTCPGGRLIAFVGKWRDVFDLLRPEPT